MSLQKPFVIAPLFALSCATPPAALHKEPLPNAAEVQTYVRANWTGDIVEDFARLADREGEPVMLVSVEDVACDYFFATPQCAIQVRARFRDGATKALSTERQFGRDASGKLEEVLVLHHP